jgi:hypothetical protein
MNAELVELVRLYEAMHTCKGADAERTKATTDLEIAVKRSSATTNLPEKLILRHVKECYFQKLRAEDQRGDKRPLVKD